ncbi:hypothetical protein BG011_009476 [Mortierella polycephala]|uniref:GCS light chain n=1 Tax=Mortierella polycephala TaxID=41804 RepID=A0A9P6Q8H8_9FUNG|nr:hypothetical protein BG011_009476 [Mortierella polycephala]
MATFSSEAYSSRSDNGTVHANGYFNGNGTQVPTGLVPPTKPTFVNDTFSHLTLYTGNTMRTGTTGQLNTSLKKSNQELISAVQETLLYSLDTARIKGDTITVTDETILGPLEADRSSYEITAKMFYLSRTIGAGVRAPLSVKQLDVAIADLEIALNIPGIKIDHFILALPNQTFDENGLDDSEVEAFTTEIQTSVMPVWTKLSELHRAGRIGRLGVAEFSKQQLEILQNAVEEDKEGVTIAPTINQVNLQDCCVLPKDLIQYSKEHGVELLTHGDSTHILPEQTLKELLEPYLPGAAKVLRPNFVLKYSALITCRGVVTKKGIDRLKEIRLETSFCKDKSGKYNGCKSMKETVCTDLAPIHLSEANKQRSRVAYLSCLRDTRKYPEHTTSVLLGSLTKDHSLSS